MTESDLNYLRGIAESGERAPLLSGRFFIWWGSLAMAAMLAHWAILAGHTMFESTQVGFIWLTYGLVGSVGSVVLRRGLKGKPGAGSAGNRGDRAVWSGMWAATLFYALGCLAAYVLGRVEVMIFDTIPLFAFASYGIAFRTIAALGGPGWMRMTAFLAWLAAAAGVAFVGRPELYLVCSGGIVVVGIVPGWLLLQAEPAAEVEA